MLEEQIVDVVADRDFIRAQLEAARALHAVIAQLRRRKQVVLGALLPESERVRLAALMEGLAARLSPESASAPPT